MFRNFRLWPILASITLAALLFYMGRSFPPIQQILLASSYVGVFIVGILYVYSFTTLPATALLLVLGKFYPIWIAGTIATFGAVLGDLTLFGLFRSSKRFAENHHEHETRYTRWWNAIEKRIPSSWRNFIIVTLVVILLVLPLPNEFADFLLARIEKVRTKTLLAISYVLNGIGIYLMLWLVKAA
jgi:uncharacterized membrane protein YdjX (TVP38/TMEM64 family)